MKTSNKIRSFSIFWSLFIGFGAFCGSIMMFADPSGKMWKMDMLLPYLQQLPLSDIFFQNFIPSGIVLFLVNGITNFISFFFIIKRRRYAGLSALFCGIILILWIIFQFFVFPMNFMSMLYFIFGLIQALTGYRYWRREKDNVLYI